MKLKCGEFMENEKKIKKEIIWLVIGLIIGMILGGIFFTQTNILSNKKIDTKEVEILNIEINNCIDKLNICENKLNDRNINLD